MWSNLDLLGCVRRIVRLSVEIEPAITAGFDFCGGGLAIGVRAGINAINPSWYAVLPRVAKKKFS